MFYAIERNYKNIFRKRKKELIKFLIENGADVNAKDKGGITALMNASNKGHIDIVHLLLEKGADVNVIQLAASFVIKSYNLR